MSRAMPALMALCGTLLAGLFALADGLPTAPMPKVVPEAMQDKDITADVKDWNSAKFAEPPSKFRAGHVKSRSFDEKAVQKTADGFTVQLPSKAPVPTPTVYRDKVYASGGFHSKEFYCFDATTGALVWAVDIDDDGPTAAVCDGGVCVFNTESCTLFAVEADTGKHLWSHWLGDPLTSTPTIANGVVFTSYPANGGGGLGENADPKANEKGAAPAGGAKKRPPCSHVLVALELKTGKILWQRWIESDVMTSPVATEKELFFATFGGVVYKLNQKDGAVLSAVRTRATSAPVVVGDDVYFSRRTDRGGAGCPVESNVALSPKTGEQRAAGGSRDAVYLDEKVQRTNEFAKGALALDAANGFGGGAPLAANPGAAWANVGYGNVSSMQAFQGSRVLHMAGKNYSVMGDAVVCNDPKTGKELWNHKLEGDLKRQGGFLGAPPAAAGGHLVMTTLKGDVLRLDADGKVLKTWETKSPSRFQPAVEGGRIYVGTQDGKLICINTGDKALTGWPCWGGNAQHTGIGAAK
ncbi:MAG: PQQ-binding-like beta-propeller repeat protein [Planctomycetes bacterium]|nr:PQQ-binding-like beta-propeller repeat protein [Planctomycetota bacterium]